MENKENERLQNMKTLYKGRDPGLFILLSGLESSANKFLFLLTPGTDNSSELVKVNETIEFLAE